MIAVKFAPEWLAKTDDLRGTDRAEEIGRVRTALLASVAGLIAATGAVYTARTFRLNRRGQITERFTRAVEQLGHDAVDVRLGGIYGLEQIARDSENDHRQVIEVLSAFVRNHSPWPTQEEVVFELGAWKVTRSGARRRGSASASANALPADPPLASVEARAVMRVLVRRNTKHERHRLVWGVDLSRTNLRGVSAFRLALPGLSDFRGAQLQEANLVGAQLRLAKFSGANLGAAHLSHAELYDADFTAAHLEGAHLEGAHLEGAHLEGAHLEGAHFEGADLQYAHLERADLRKANLEDADLREASYDKETVWPSARFDAKGRGAHEIRS